MSKIILGIDPGLNCTGLGLVQAWPGKVEYLDHQVIRTNSKESLVNRLDVICSGITDYVAAKKPDAAAVEDVFYSVNIKSALLLGQTRGAIIATLLNCGTQVHEFTALQIKKSVVGYGKADKTQVCRMVEVLLGRSFKKVPADATDALACGICLSLNLTGRNYGA